VSYLFGKKSLACLETCHPDLQKIAHELIKEVDVAVICGHRGKKEQDEAYRRGRSKLKFPKSKHNKLPSLAMDIAPCGRGGRIDWDNVDAFRDMCSRVERIAQSLNIKIRLGRDFKGFVDLPHIELA
jgi:peptidoglycan L-alanyl-D-glutamate endopeptidase CwlK